jgi:hypothetical protein
MGAMGLVHEILFHDTGIRASRVKEDAQFLKRYNNRPKLNLNIYGYSISLCVSFGFSFVPCIKFILLQVGAEMLR